jgi:hypothetical protein
MCVSADNDKIFGFTRNITLRTPQTTHAQERSHSERSEESVVSIHSSLKLVHFGFAYPLRGEILRFAQNDTFCKAISVANATIFSNGKMLQKIRHRMPKRLLKLRKYVWNFHFAGETPAFPGTAFSVIPIKKKMDSHFCGNPFQYLMRGYRPRFGRICSVTLQFVVDAE